MIKVLVVDDSALMRKALGNILRAAGDIEVAFARNGVEAVSQLHGFAPDVVTLDIHMPEMDGLACLDRIMIERPSRVVMVASLTAAGAHVTLEAMALGAVDFVAKPEGVISLSIDAFAPVFLERVRAASRARLRPTARLAERVRLRARAGGPAPVAVRTPPSPRRIPQATDSIVLVGTSTGGPPALDALLSPLPADFPWPILIAQHMPASFTGPLARRLDRLCALHVVEVTGADAHPAGHRLYRARRCRHDREPPAERPHRNGGPRRSGAALAPECRAPGDDGDGAHRPRPPDRGAHDGHGQ